MDLKDIRQLRKTRGKTPRTKPKPVRRETLGRPTLYPGKTWPKHITAYLTPEGYAKLDDIKELLLQRCQRERRDINSISVSDAVEEAIHKLHRELTRRKDA